MIEDFVPLYRQAAKTNGLTDLEIDHILDQFRTLVSQEKEHPHTFEPYHQRITTPFNYYQFGLDFIRPMIDKPHSTILRADLIDEIEAHRSQGDNIIFFANHQTEPDPQVISLLLEEKAPKLAEEMIFVAGHWVITDPLAIPFSLGRNLLCIYSKKYIENPPELKAEKQAHNQKSLHALQELLKEGGKAIYVAPSGGRDRLGPTGNIEIAHFDPASIELFYLMARQSKRLCHFHPLTLATYNLLPPPQTEQRGEREPRIPHHTPVKMAIGEEIDMENLHQEDPIDKHHARKLRADWIWQHVVDDYHHLTTSLNAPSNTRR